MIKIHSPIVLMYHGVIADNSQIPPEREPGAELYDVELADFKEQMQFIKDHDYTVSHFDVSASAEGKVVLTFDDGEFNNFQNAYSILRPLNFSAYFFITVQRVGKNGYMGWEELKELRDTGMIIGSHGLTHALLTSLKEKQIEKELLESKALLERQLKINIEDFSVPRGFSNDDVIRLAKAAGYKRMFVSSRITKNSFCIGRIPVKSHWGINRFVLALQGRVPFSEAVTDNVKGFLQKVLGGPGYDRLRRRILRSKG